VVRAGVARGAWPPTDGPGDRALARAAVEEVLTRFEQEGRVGDPAVWAARREAILARVERFVAAEARQVDGLAPALLEHRFGGSSGRPPLAFEWEGERVLLQGRIDRVDASPGRLLVIDYKSSGDARRHAAQLAPPALGVTSFQPPVYLLAAARELPGRSSHAATYLLLRRPERLAPVALDPADLRAGAGEGDPGRPLAAAVAGIVGRIRSGDFPIVSADCRGCPFGAVCRFEGAPAPDAEAAA
jgi:ATP-dependent helicase/DNAse subunit B